MYSTSTVTRSQHIEGIHFTYNNVSIFKKSIARFIAHHPHSVSLMLCKNETLKKKKTCTSISLLSYSKGENLRVTALTLISPIDRGVDKPFRNGLSFW